MSISAPPRPALPQSPALPPIADPESLYRDLEPVIDPVRRATEPWRGLSSWATAALTAIAQQPELRRDQHNRVRISHALYAQVIDGILLAARTNGVLKVGIDGIVKQAGTSRDAVKETLRVLAAAGLARRAFRGRPKNMQEHELVVATGRKTFRWVSVWVLIEPAALRRSPVDNLLTPPPSGGIYLGKKSYVTINLATWNVSATRKEEGASRPQPLKRSVARRAKRSYTPAVNLLYARLAAQNSLFQVSSPGRLKSALSRFAAAGCTPTDILSGLAIAKTRLGWTTPDGRVHFADRWLCALLKVLDPQELRPNLNPDPYVRDDYWITQHIDGDSPVCQHGKPGGDGRLPSGRTYCWQCEP